MRLWPDLCKTQRAAQLLAGQSFDKTKVPTSALNTNYGPDGSDRRVLSCVKCPGVDLPRLQARTALCILDRQHFESGSWNPWLTWKYILVFRHTLHWTRVANSFSDQIPMGSALFWQGLQFFLWHFPHWVANYNRVPNIIFFCILRLVPIFYRAKIPPGNPRVPTRLCI